MQNKTLTYLDFANDELQYFSTAYTEGLRHNAMVSQAQRICECYLKEIISRKNLYEQAVMTSHNLRTIYEYIVSKGIDLSPIRTEIMLLNNFYTHTRYPGRDAFLASSEDVTAAYNAVHKIVQHVYWSCLS